MTKVYACLTGNWVCLNDDPNCVISGNHSSPLVWWEEGADIYSPATKEHVNSLYGLEYVNLHYLGKDYRIHPMFIQIVTE